MQRIIEISYANVGIKTVTAKLIRIHTARLIKYHKKDFHTNVFLTHALVTTPLLFNYSGPVPLLL